MSRLLNIFIILIFNCIIIKTSFAISYSEYKTTDSIPSYTSPYIPDTIFFCGQKVPLHQLSVKEKLDRELTQNAYFHSNIILNLKRANRYFPIIDSIFNIYHIPHDLKYLCVAESNLTQTVSPAKAIGFWQFMESTGKIYGLEIRNGIDERYHIEKATEAACKYLKDLYNHFNKDWFLAAAAYNMGESGLKLALKRQKVNNYWDLWLNSETARYVYRIISYKLIMENPQQYYFNLKNIDLYPPLQYQEIKIDTNITSLYQFAATQQISYKILKELNYWLRDTSLIVKGQTYYLKIPEMSF